MLIIAVKYYAYGFLCNLLCLLGILGNSLTLYILNGSKEMRKQSINIYLTVLALYDNGVLVFSILMFNLPAITDYQQVALMQHSSTVSITTNLSPIPEFTTSVMSEFRQSLVARAEARISSSTSGDITAPKLFPPDPRANKPNCLLLAQTVESSQLPFHATSTRSVRSALAYSTIALTPSLSLNQSNADQDRMLSCLLDIFQTCFKHASYIPGTEPLPTEPSLVQQSQLTRLPDKSHINLVVTRLWLLLRRAVSLFSNPSTSTSSPSKTFFLGSSLDRIPQQSPECNTNLLALLGFVERQVNKDHRQQDQTMSNWVSEPVAQSMSTLVHFLENDLVAGGHRVKRHQSNNTVFARDSINLSSDIELQNQHHQNQDLDNSEPEQDLDEQQPPMPGSLYPLLYYVKIVYPLALIAQTGSIWTTCLITIERYLAVCHPLMSLTLSTRSRAIWALSILSVMAFVFNLPRFVEVDTSGDSIRPSELRRNQLYYHVYYICLNLSLNYILPLSLLSALNIKIYASVRYANRHRNELTRARQSELHLTSMLVLIVAIFIACNAPAFVVNCLEPYLDYGTTFLEIVTIFSNVLVCFNSASNFVIYCIFGKKFRSKLKQALGLRRTHCSVRSLRGCYMSRQYSSSPAITTTTCNSCKVTLGLNSVLPDVSDALIDTGTILNENNLELTRDANSANDSSHAAPPPSSISLSKPELQTRSQQHLGHTHSRHKLSPNSHQCKSDLQFKKIEPINQTSRNTFV